MKIKYCITACNEDVELNILLSHLITHKINKEDIFVLVDNTNHTQEVINVINKHEITCNVRYSLNKDFATFKNYLFEFVDKEYNFIFQLDADELPSADLLKDLPGILEYNFDIEVIGVPRKNTVQGITNEYIKQMGWKYIQDKYINPPDYQLRIYKHNGKIRWNKAVHEQLTGYKRFSVFHEQLQSKPDQWEYYLDHNKTMEKQIKQNNFYEEINKMSK